MVDLLLTVVLVGVAATYILELLDLSIVGEFLGRTTINTFFSLPLCLGGMFAMQQQWSIEMLVTVPAATFVTLAVGKYLNKPVTVSRLPRL